MSVFSFLRIAERQLIKNHNGYILATQFYGTKLGNKEACAVMKSWKGLQKKVDKVAKDFFCGLFTEYPEYAKLFKRFGDCPEEIMENKCFLKEHAVGKVFKNFGKAISKIDDADEVTAFTVGIGKKHVKYCMQPEHFLNSRPILFKAIEKNVCEMDCTTKKGWEAAIKLIMSGLAKGLKC